MADNNWHKTRRTMGGSLPKGYPEGRIAHIYVDYKHRLYHKGTHKKEGYFPVYLRWEDTGKVEFIAYTKWKRSENGVTVIDQYEFYEWADKEEAE